MTKWVDFEAIKRRVPITAVLEHYRIDGLKRSGKAHLRGRCPLHGGEGRETFHINTAEQLSSWQVYRGVAMRPGPVRSSQRLRKK